MDDFTRKQFPPKNLFHHIAMFSHNGTIIQMDENITVLMVLASGPVRMFIRYNMF